MVCKDCVAGALHGGTPTGSETTLHGLPTYVAEPPAGQEAKGVVVIIPDAFGWDLINNRILADNYAKKGPYKVYLPDFMNGKSVAADALQSMHVATDSNAGIMARLPNGLRAASHLIPFLISNRPSVTTPRVNQFFRGVRSETDLPIGAAGFCWGGKFVTLMCSGEPKTSDGKKPLLDCGYTAHPSNLDLPKDAQGIKLPLSVAYPTKDFGLPPEKFALMKAELDKRDYCEYVEYEGAEHGFAVRGDPDDEVQKRQGEEAEEQAIAFFSKCFGQSKL